MISYQIRQINQFLTRIHQIKLLNSDEQEYYERLRRKYIQEDIDKLRDSIGEEFFIPVFILRQGMFSEPIDVEYMNAEKRLLKKIMAEEEVKEWIAFVKENDENSQKSLATKEKNAVRNRILEESNRASYGFPKRAHTTNIEVINEIRASKGKSPVAFNSFKKVWLEMDEAEKAEVKALQRKMTDKEKHLTQRRAASMKVCPSLWESGFCFYL